MSKNVTSSYNFDFNSNLIGLAVENLNFLSKFKNRNCLNLYKQKEKSKLCLFPGKTKSD